MAKLFGFSIEDKEKLAPSTLSPVPPNNEDGVDHYITSGFFGSHIDIEGVYRTEFDLIKRYREMALHHEVSSAIEDIVNEAIVSDTNDSPIKIELSNLNASDELKELIRKEFKTILELLDFDKKAHEIYRNWYIDGRLYYHKVIDLKDPHQGIQELRYIDAMKMRHVRKAKKEDKTKQILRTTVRGEVNPLDLAFPELEEYFVYTPRAEQPIGTPSTGQLGGSDAGIKFAKDSITYCTSGLVDRNKGTTLSYLNIAIKPLNQLRMIEDAIVIYRLTRSVERRIFYIDVGNLPKAKAEQFLRETMLRYRNKLNYNSTTGEVTDSRRQMSMMEDFFLPRREGGRGTEITTLPPGCFSMDTKVSLLDGRELSIREVEEEMNNGKQLWTYSCNPDTGKIVPGLISWAGVTQKSAQVIKLTLDNGEEIICTPEHKFVAREGGFVEAQNFKIGDSLMPLHRKNEKISSNASSYEMVYDNDDQTWKLLNQDNGYKLFSDLSNTIQKKEEDLNDYKILSIEWLNEPMEVGTLTIDSNEQIHGYHTFALSAGIFVKNSNLGELTDLNYFKKELYKSLEVPSSRIDGDGGFNLGRSSEILRDEVKFSKFVGRLRKRFSNLFVDLLKTQLILKNIVTLEDWKRMSEHIQFDFLYDNHFAELKEAELLSERLNMVSLAEPYVGKYFSRDYLRRTVLKQTDEEIVEQDKIIEKEIEDGAIPDPNSIDPETGMPLPQEDPSAMGNNIQGDSGKVPVDPQIDTSSVEAPKPKGGEI